MDNKEKEIIDQLHDIYGMIHVPFWQTRQFFLLMLTLGSLLLLLCLWFGIKWWRRRHAIKYPWDHALEQLNALEKQEFQAVQSRLFYLTLTSIIKEYLDNRFALQLVSKTDDELLACMSEFQLPHEVKQGLQEIFDGVTFIKFAHAAAAQERMQRDLIASKKLVSATIPQKSGQ